MNSNQIYKMKILDLPFCSIYLESDTELNNYCQIQTDEEKKRYPDVKDLTYAKVSVALDGEKHFVRCYPDDWKMKFESYYDADQFVESRVYENEENNIRFVIGCWGEAWPVGDIEYWDNGFDYEVGCPEEGISYNIKNYTITDTFVFAIGWIFLNKKVDSYYDSEYQLGWATDLTYKCSGVIEFNKDRFIKR